MIDDHGRRQRGEEVPEFRQVDGFEIDDDMPAELGDAPGDFEQLVLRREVDETLDEVEAHAAHAGCMQVLQLGVGHAALDRRDAARPAIARAAGVGHRAIVGPVAGRLHDHVAREAEVIAQREQLRLRGVAGRVFALGRIGEFGARPEDMAMRIDRAFRQDEARLSRARVPVEPA